MIQKIEGTLLLEGLIEGPLPPFPDAQQKLEHWAQDAKPIRMTLHVDSGRFSAMPPADPVAVEPTGQDASPDIAQQLGDLLRFFPPLEKSQVFSTLRSTEWRHKLEIKTLYAVGPDGRPATRQERVVAETVAREQPLPAKQIVFRAAVGLAVAVALLAVSALFIDYPKLWRNLTASVEPVTVKVDDNAFAPYLKLDVKSLDRKNGTLVLVLTRSKNYPLSDADFDKLAAHLSDPPPSPATAPASQPATQASTQAATQSTTIPAAVPGVLRRRLAVEALANGTIHLNLFDDKGQFLGQSAIRVADLQSHAILETDIPAPVLSNHLVPPATIVLTP